MLIQSISQVGDVFIVCDAGGGTVVTLSFHPLALYPITYFKDLISYVVQDLAPLKIKECAVGTGMSRPRLSEDTSDWLGLQANFVALCSLIQPSRSISKR